MICASSFRMVVFSARAPNLRCGRRRLMSSTKPVAFRKRPPFLPLCPGQSDRIRLKSWQGGAIAMMMIAASSGSTCSTTPAMSSVLGQVPPLPEPGQALLDHPAASAVNLPREGRLQLPEAPVQDVGRRADPVEEGKEDDLPAVGGALSESNSLGRRVGYLVVRRGPVLSLAAVVLTLVAAGGPRLLPPRVPLAPVALPIIVVCPLLVLLAVALAAAAPPILVSISATVISSVISAVFSPIVAVVCTIAPSIAVAASASATALVVVVIVPAPILAVPAATPAAGAARRIGLEVIVVGAAVGGAALRCRLDVRHGLVHHRRVGHDLGGHLLERLAGPHFQGYGPRRFQPQPLHRSDCRGPWRRTSRRMR